MVTPLADGWGLQNRLQFGKRKWVGLEGKFQRTECLPNILINSLNKSRVTIAYVKEYIN